MKWYSEAITDALNPEPSEIVNYLWGINPSHPQLQYKNIDGELYVKAVSWMSQSAYDKYYKASMGQAYPVTYPSWVTLVPQIQASCQLAGYDNSYPMELRLRMALGLPPSFQEEPSRVFVEMWVRPQDVNRPAATPDPYTNFAGLDIPINVTDEYRLWFNDTRAYQYTLDGVGYPWTQLGYTYDWAPQNTNHVGFSEYVLKTDITVYLDAAYPTEEYCTDEN
ncbi:MAG TPA: hypothetical protein DCR93_39490 [Cytophagales bacterium]|nr:hypothetical protein [Cytophagales bacterium]HAP65310.1 hypothetical protein [Cytophagales bacterium]